MKKILTRPSNGLVRRFWKRVNKSSGCWIFGTGPVTKHGQICEGRRGSVVTHYAHRLSFQIHKSNVIPAGLFVCHKCDVPACVRPDHLFLGTPKDNSQDSVKKGRFIKGEMVASSVLKGKAVLRIRKEYAKRNVTQQHLADKNGVSLATISKIVTGKTWSHLAGVRL